jgi:SAM-dependent methyltransferase
LLNYRYILAPYVPTPADVVDRMLRLAEVTNKDLVYDLGCGDGRMVIAAPKDFGARGVGVDIEPYWIEESRQNAKKAGVEHLTTFRVEDAMCVDLSPATVVMLYLVEWSVGKLRTIIEGTAKSGARVVSHSFGTETWVPAKFETFVDVNGQARNLYLWIT